MSDSALGVGLKARPNSSAVEHLTYKVKGREFEPCSGRLFSRTLYFVKLSEESSLLSN